MSKRGPPESECGGTREEGGGCCERLDAAAGDRGADGVGCAGDAVVGPGDDADSGVDEAANDRKGVRDGVNDRFSFSGLMVFHWADALTYYDTRGGPYVADRKVGKLSDVSGSFH